jgi:hypothetical protein
MDNLVYPMTRTGNMSTSIGSYMPSAHPLSSILSSLRVQKNLPPGLKSSSSIHEDIWSIGGAILNNVYGNVNWSDNWIGIKPLLKLAGAVFVESTYGILDTAYTTSKKTIESSYKSPVEAAVAICLASSLYGDTAVNEAITNFLKTMLDELTLKPIRDKMFESKAGRDGAKYSNYINPYQYIPSDWDKTGAGFQAWGTDYVTAWHDLLVALQASTKLPTVFAAAAAAVLNHEWKK